MKTSSFQPALLALALVAGGLSLSPQAATPAEGAGDPFPPPAAGMTIEVGEDEGPNLQEILVEFGKASGEHLIWSEDTGVILRQTRSGLDRGLEVAPEELYSVIETIMITNRFVFTDLRREEPRMLAVASLDSPARSTIRSGVTYVPPDQLEFYADHPGILITTAVQLDRMEVRTTSNLMRAMVVDPLTMQVVPVPDSNTMILSGFGANIVQLARMLREVNDCTPEPEPVPRGR